MSTTPESGSREFELDLDLHFLPAWAQKPPTENIYAKYESHDRERPQHRSDRREGPRDRPSRRDQGRPMQPRGERPGGRRRDGGRPEPVREREPAPPPIELNVSIIPEEKGVESLARQIRLTGRAYPLFDIAFLILKKPDRYTVRFDVIKKADGQPAQPLLVCGLDDTLWLSEQDAIDHVLDKHFSTFYQSEKIPTDPPKGTYTFVAQCGMSGVILGPPNYHDYQNKIRKLHAERFSRVPFEAYKSRIKIVREEATVKKWLEDQSWKTEYVCLNVPEAIKLTSREEVERHFRETHFPNVIKSVDSHTVSGTAAQALPSRSLHQLVRRAWDEQMRFPLKVVNVLSQQFAGHGLQFFKVNKTVTHVAVARPRYLDVQVTPVSEGITRIVDFISATPNCSRRKILEALAPGVQLQAAPAAEGAATPPSPEAAAVVSDLHWLIHQGHVIEFANGLIELAKKPLPRPPKPERIPAKSEGAAAKEAGTTVEQRTTETAQPAESGDAAPSEATTPEANVETHESSAPLSEVEATESEGVESAPVELTSAEQAPAEFAPVPDAEHVEVSPEGEPERQVAPGTSQS